MVTILSVYFHGTILYNNLKANMITMFNKLISKFNEAPLYYGIVFSPFLVLMTFFLYEALYWLVLNIWCGLYGLGDPYKFWG